MPDTPTETPRVARYVPHATAATIAVIAVPALLVHLLVPADTALLLVFSAVLAAALSLGAARAGARLWSRSPRSPDLLFTDLMLWGMLRRLRAERRLADPDAVLGSFADDGGAATPARRIRTLKRLTGMLEARDAYTDGHARRVARHAERLARALGLPDAEVARIRTAAALHDVGKVRTPIAILRKPGALTDAERATMARHPLDGAAMVAPIADAELTAIVRHHHERFDGAGYPDGLAGEAIPLGARIIAVADTFDAMTSSRSYRRAASHRKALEVIERSAGSQLDPAVVAAFLSYYSGRRAIGWAALGAAVPPRVAGLLGAAGGGLLPGGAAIGQVLPSVGVATFLATAVAGTAAPPRSAIASSASPATPAVRTADPTPRAADRDAAVAPGRPGTRDGVSSARPDNATARRRERVPARAKRTPAAATPAPSTAPAGTAAASPPAAVPPRDSSSTPPAAVPTPKPTPAPAPTAPKVELPPVQTPAVETPPIQTPAVETPPIQLPATPVTPAIEVPPVRVPPVTVPPITVPPVTIELPR